MPYDINEAVPAPEALPEKAPDLSGRAFRGNFDLGIIIHPFGIEKHGLYLAGPGVCFSGGPSGERTFIRCGLRLLAG